jgi:uncharacterized protein YraI
MLRRLLLVAFLFAAIVAGFQRPAPAGALSCDPCPAYVNYSVNLRSSGNMSASVLAVLPAGATVAWFPTTGVTANGFVRVRYNSIVGYAFADYLTMYPAGGNTLANLNLRSGAGTGFSVKLVMPSGAAIQVIGGPANGFYQVEYNLNTGWASATYLSFVDANVSWYPGETPQTLAGVRLRSGVGTSFSTIATLPSGTYVTILSGPFFANNLSWYRVQTAVYGQGYVAGQYLGY